MSGVDYPEGSFMEALQTSLGGMMDWNLASPPNQMLSLARAQDRLERILATWRGTGNWPHEDRSLAAFEIRHLPDCGFHPYVFRRDATSRLGDLGRTET